MINAAINAKLTLKSNRHLWSLTSVTTKKAFGYFSIKTKQNTKASCMSKHKVKNVR